MSLNEKILMTASPIELLSSESELEESFILFQQLIPKLEKSVFLKSAKELQEKDTSFFGLRDEGALRAVARVSFSFNLSGTRLAWIHSFVTKENFRGQGYGTKLYTGMRQLLKEQGCQEIRLHSQLFRKKAHDFWRQKVGMNEFALVLSDRLD